MLSVSFPLNLFQIFTREFSSSLFRYIPPIPTVIIKMKLQIENKK